MATTYRETIAGINLVARGDRLTLRRSRASSLQTLVPIGILGYVILLAIRLLRALFRAPWTFVVWWIMVLLLAVLGAVFYAHNRRRLIVGRDGTVRQGRKTKSFGPGLRISPHTAQSGATFLYGESPTRPSEKLADSPFFMIAHEAEWIAVCVNDFLGHPRPDGVVEYPRPV